jgi:quinol monooxygenase YgiN
MSLGGIAFEADLTRDQVERLAELMVQARPTRPQGVLTASLEYLEGRARLVAIWRDQEALSDYLATGAVPRGTELMRAVGAEPAVSRFEVLELG